MAPGGGFLDLERHFAFYGAYHSNPVNVFIHALFVWPIFLTALLLLHLTAPSLHSAAVGAAIYGAFYISLDRRSGTVAAVLCFLCWAASAALAARLGYSVGCKVTELRPFCLVPLIGFFFGYLSFISCLGRDLFCTVLAGLVSKGLGLLSV